MVAKEFLDYLVQFKFVQTGGVSDLCDRCIYILTFSILLVCSAVVTVKSYILEPMSCYVATNVEGANNLAYINNYCWITGTVPREVHHGSRDDDQYWDSLKPHMIHYYQWVPLVLGIQAAMLYLPYMFWECLVYNRLGTNLPFIVDMARKASLDLGPSRQAKVHRVADHVLNLLLSSRTRSGPWPCGPWNRSRVQIVLLYLVLKVASLVTLGCQFILMDSFLDMKTPDRLFGLSLFRDMIQGRHWSRTNLFPRMGFCRVRFKVHHSSGSHVLAQCSLSMNMLHEKVFLFLWWWFCAMVVLQVSGVFLWLRRCFFTQSRLDFLHKVVLVQSGPEALDPTLVRDFDQEVFAIDGCFLIHITRLNCGDLVCNEVVGALLAKYKALDRTPLPRALLVTTDSNKSIFV